MSCVGGATADQGDWRVLHVVVGHGLPQLYLNTIRSLRSIAPGGSILVVDNASADTALRDQLIRLAAADDGLELVLRAHNDLTNGKVGGLYSAYSLAFERAMESGFSHVHLLQADMQALWWDERATAAAAALYRRHPGAVNIQTMALSSDRWLVGDVAPDESTGDHLLTGYGLTDTGLYDLERWHSHGLQFGPSEEAHGAEAWRRGCQVPILSAPTELQVPWPAVIRQGRQVGREVIGTQPFLCKPLDASRVDSMLGRPEPDRLEDVCVPWGWVCLSPMWNTDLGRLDYWALRRRSLRENGWRRGRPRFAGLPAKPGPLPWLRVPHRPLVRMVIRQSLPALVQHSKRVIRRHRRSSG